MQIVSGDPMHNHTNVTDPIDAVITWVDGSAPSHQRKRTQYLAGADAELSENATNPHRWSDNDEISYCLKSIEKFAPWTRKIWIVTDQNTPDLSTLSDDLRKKISIVFHEAIFAELSAALPTFNSLAIESLIWRIEGLSERFLYFNDDVFLSAPLEPTDFFQGQKTILRGEWVDYQRLESTAANRQDPAKFNHFMQLNAAMMMGFKPQKLFAAAHIVHPMRRSIMAQLYRDHQSAFIKNINFRFRDLSQFLPQALHNHACIAANKATIHLNNDYIHIHSGQGNNRPPSEIWNLLKSVESNDIKFLCINDLPQLELLVPNIRDWLDHMMHQQPEIAQ